MNVDVINTGTRGTIGYYVAFALSLTIVTAWIIMAFQSKYLFPPETSFIKRLAWPMFITDMITQRRQPLAKKPVPDYSPGGRQDF